MKQQVRRMVILSVMIISMGIVRIPAFAENGPEAAQPAEAPSQEAELMESNSAETPSESAFFNPVELIARMSEQGMIDRSTPDGGQQGDGEGTYSETDVKTLINQINALLSDSSPTSGTVTTSGARLNVRNGGGMDHEIIDHLENGETIRVVGEDNGWYKVEGPDYTGYVSGEYLTVQPGEEITKDELLQRLEAMLMGQTYVPQAQTPEQGNMTMVDEVVDTGGARRQFVTLVSKNGNYFYLVIDRDEKGQNNVYFLNQVDERDLFSLMDEEDAAALKEEMAAEEAARQEAEALEHPTQEGEKAEKSPKRSGGGIIAFLLLLLVGLSGGAGFFLWKLKNDKAAENMLPDPDADYEDEDDLDEEALFEEDDFDTRGSEYHHGQDEDAEEEVL